MSFLSFFVNFIVMFEFLKIFKNFIFVKLVSWAEKRMPTFKIIFKFIKNNEKIFV